MLHASYFYVLCNVYYSNVLVFHLACRYGVLSTLLLYEVACSLLMSTFCFSCCCLFLYPKVFQLQKVFSKMLVWVFQNRLLCESNTCKGKTTYTWISPYPTQVGLHRELLLLLLYIPSSIPFTTKGLEDKRASLSWPQKKP